MKTYYRDFPANLPFRASEYARHRSSLGHNVRRERVEVVVRERIRVRRHAVEVQKPVETITERIRVYFSPGFPDPETATPVPHTTGKPLHAVHALQ